MKQNKITPKLKESALADYTENILSLFNKAALCVCNNDKIGFINLCRTSFSSPRRFDKFFSLFPVSAFENEDCGESIIRFFQYASIAKSKLFEDLDDDFHFVEPEYTLKSMELVGFNKIQYSK